MYRWLFNSIVIIKGVVCLYCLCKWSCLSSLRNENKPSVILWYTRYQYWYAIKNSIKWTMVKSLSVVLFFVIYCLLNIYEGIYTYECIANGGPLPTCVQTFRLVRLILPFYHIKTLLTNQYWCCMPTKTSLKLIHYCTLLSMAHHFDACNNNISHHIS